MKWRAKTDARTVTHRDFPLRAQTRLAANRSLGRVNSPLSTVAAVTTRLRLSQSRRRI